MIKTFLRQFGLKRDGDTQNPLPSPDVTEEAASARPNMETAQAPTPSAPEISDADAPSPSLPSDVGRKEEGPERSAHETQARLNAVCREAETLSKTEAWLTADESFAALFATIAELDPRDTKPEYRRRVEAFRDIYAGRRAAMEKEKSAIDARDRRRLEVASLIGRFDDESMARVEQIEREWETLETAPARFMEILEKGFRQATRDFRETAKTAKKRHEELTALREETRGLLARAETLAGVSENWEAAEQEFQRISARWTECLALAPEFNVDAARFEDAFERYRDRRDQRHRELQEAAEQELARLSKLCEEMETFSRAEDIASALPRVKEIQTIWENAEALSSLRVVNLKNRYEKASKTFFDKLRMLRQEADWARWENFALKLSLCERTEALLTRMDLYHVSKELKDILDQWKNIGHVPREKADETRQRFQTAWNAVKARCDEFFDKLREEKRKNLELKIALCEEVEALKDASDWGETTKKVKEARERWKAIGMVPVEETEAIFGRFQAACDAFFERRKVFFEERAKTQEENRQAKEAYCVAAEKLMEASWREGSEKVRELKARWRETGSARREVERALWERFNAAIDAFQAKLKAEEPENERRKEALIQEIERLLEPLSRGEEINFTETAAKVAELNLRWKEIGPVDKDKTADLWRRFDGPIRTFFEERKTRYEQASREWRENLAKKEALLEKITALAENNDNWIKAAEEVKRVQEEWKTIGAVEKSKTRELWDRYHAVCDAFFERKKGFFEALNAERRENLKRKRALCARVEKIVGVDPPPDTLSAADTSLLAEELKSAIESNFVSAHTPPMAKTEIFEEIKKLQEQWKHIGPAPLRDEQALYERFRRACDVFFTKTPNSARGKSEKPSET